MLKIISYEQDKEMNYISGTLNKESIAVRQQHITESYNKVIEMCKESALNGKSFICILLDSTAGQEIFDEKYVLKQIISLLRKDQFKVKYVKGYNLNLIKLNKAITQEEMIKISW